MFERFTSQARRVLALAQEEARFLGHDRCGTEHLLLGLIRDEGDAGEALRRQGMQLDTARSAVSNVRGRSSANLAIAGSGSLPFSPNAKAAVQAAVNDANASQSNVDSNHLLFGVLRDQSPTVQSVLAQLRGAPAPAPTRVSEAAPVAPIVATPQPPVVEPAGIVDEPSREAPAVSASEPLSLEARVDQLTERVDHLQAMVTQLSQSASVRST